MANAVRSLNEELAVQHDIVERGMSARVDALRDAYDDEANRIRERANVSIDAARKSVTEANERVSRMEEACATLRSDFSRRACETEKRHAGDGRGRGTVRAIAREHARHG